MVWALFGIIVYFGMYTDWTLLITLKSQFDKYMVYVLHVPCMVDFTYLKNLEICFGFSRRMTNAFFKQRSGLCSSINSKSFVQFYQQNCVLNLDMHINWNESSLSYIYQNTKETLIKILA